MTSPKTQIALLRRRNREVPDNRPQATLSEVFAVTPADAAATGFALAHLRGVRGPVLWVQDHLSRREAGMPYPAGLPFDLGLMHLDVARPVDALWAMEEALGCPALGGIIGEVWGAPQVLDFTASKRLAIRAEAHGVPLWLIRRAASPDLSAARERWRVASLPSWQNEDDSRAPGQPVWRADLFRARWRQPGSWVARLDPARGLIMDHGSEGAASESPVASPVSSPVASPVLVRHG